MDLAKVLSHIHPDLAGWEVVNNEITKFPDSVPEPTQAELDTAWAEVQSQDRILGIREERKRRYREESDGLLFDALAKMDLPELAEWQDAQMKIKKELPKPLKM